MKENLGFAHMGNGVSVWDSNRKLNNDYLIIAHIRYERTISWYIDDISKEAKAEIIKYAAEKNMYISATQFQKALKPLGYSQEEIDTIRKSWSLIAKEEVEIKIFDLSDDVYALGSETACLLLAYHFRKKEIKMDYSVNLGNWYFIRYEQYELM